MKHYSAGVGCQSFRAQTPIKTEGTKEREKNMHAISLLSGPTSGTFRRRPATTSLGQKKKPPQEKATDKGA